MGAADPARVAALFDEVADLEPAQAARVLAEACAGMPTVRARVEQLLAHDRAPTRGPLVAPGEVVLAALRERSNGPVEPERPTRIGRFRVLERIGEGGMGVVYVAYDEALDRRVALKLLHGDGTAGAWLLREGQALGRVAHPNVVTVYEVGEHDGRAYLAMELVEGPTLRAWLAEERRTFGDVLRVFLAVGRGLAAVHAAGLVHRDFKPDNVMIGGDGRPQIADFGVSALAAHGAAAEPRGGHALETSLVQRGRLVGTPAYMAPEVLQGERATAASDQWSFCAALYRAAYGTPPFRAPDGDFAALAQLVLEGAPAPPPRRSDVPSWLGPILLRGLARDPARRFEDLNRLLQEIQAHLPRDPDLDPSIVRHDVRILRLSVLVAAGLAASFTATGHLPIAPPSLALVSALLLVVEAAVVSLRWRSLARNTFGRRSAGILVGTTGAVLFHRLLSLQLGTSHEDILVVDLLLLSVVYGFVAVAIQKWVGLLASFTALASVVGALFPAVVVPAFVAGSLGSFLIVTADAFRRR